jgi:hypothetical protein
MNLSNLIYVVGHCAIGTLLGGVLAGWLRWLFLEAESGRQVDHGFDYGYSLYLLGGMVLGFVLALWLSLSAIAATRTG